MRLQDSRPTDVGGPERFPADLAAGVRAGRSTHADQRSPPAKSGTSQRASGLVGTWAAPNATSRANDLALSTNRSKVSQSSDPPAGPLVPDLIGLCHRHDPSGGLGKRNSGSWGSRSFSPPRPAVLQQCSVRPPRRSRRRAPTPPRHSRRRAPTPPRRSRRRAPTPPRLTGHQCGNWLVR